MAKGGRPSMYTQELAKSICDRLANGESLRTICKSEGMPTRETVRVWRNDNPDFSGQYARAREDQADFYADECIEIADDKSQDILDIKEGGDTRMITNSAAVQRAKLQCEMRKWKASQLAPKRWGQQNATVTGADGGAIAIKLTIEEKKLPRE